MPNHDEAAGVRREVRGRIGGDIADDGTSRESLAQIDSLLTPASAVQIALACNPRVRIALGELGIARADAIEAVTLDNPSLGGAVQFPDDGSGYTVDLEIGQNIQKLLLMASSRKLSRIQLEEAQLAAARAIIDVAAEAEAAYFDAVAARHAASVNRLIAEATAASCELASRQYDAGNLSDLEAARERGMFEDARVALADSELAADRALHELHRVLALPAADAARFDIPGQLPALPAEEVDLAAMEPFAVENSLDLSIRRKQAEAMAQALGIARDWAWLGTVEFGVLAERELDRTWLVGPSLHVELPLFDQGQAERARQESRLRQSEQELIEAAIALRADVRIHRQRLHVDRQKASHYLGVIIPNRENIVKLSQRQYNFMLTGVNQVLDAKRDEYAAYREYIDALRDYWMTRAELRRFAGGRLPGEEHAPDAHSTHDHERKSP